MLLIGLPVLLTTACSESTDYEDVETVEWCFACHGSPENGDSAPPPTSWRDGDSADAHRQHLDAAEWHAAVECVSCHQLPTAVGDKGHVDSDLPAELIFSGLAEADDAVPRYNPATSKCSETYCHGATLEAGGALTEPSWNVVDGSQDECGTCHGAPPAGEHPQSDRCEVCHDELMAADGIFVAPELHIDGSVEANEEVECNACHGNETNSAPPADTVGNTETDAPGVGAHQAHLDAAGLAWRAEVTCNECHVVPENVDEDGHLDTSLPAELTWGSLAKADDASPVYNNDSRCSDVYCHGATLLEGGANTEPDWTVVDGTQDACGSCHSLPPAGGHPNSDDCSACHGEVVADDGGFIAPERHIDGEVDVKMACNSCHGGGDDPEEPANWAPPAALDGSIDTSEPGVGAHQEHLRASDWRAAIDCGGCHPTIEEVDDDRHLDETSPADVEWGAGDVARAQGAVPTYDRENNRCSDVYCHGAKIASGSGAEDPVWTTVDGTQAACGEACHALPPGGGHPPQDNCSGCHRSVVDADRNITCAEFHINGRIFDSGSCPD